MGALQDTAIFSFTSTLTQDPSTTALAEVFAFTPDGENPEILSLTATPFPQTTITANWDISDFGGSLPDLSTMYVRQLYGNSANGAIETGLWTVADVYLDFVYDNEDPALDPITLRYRPTTYSLINNGSQCTMSATAGPPPTATLQCNFTSPLSSRGEVRWTGWALSQRF